MIKKFEHIPWSSVEIHTPEVYFKYSVSPIYIYIYKAQSKRYLFSVA